MYNYISDELSLFFVMAISLKKRIRIFIILFMTVSIFGLTCVFSIENKNWANEIESDELGTDEIVIAGDSYTQHFLKDIGDRRKEFIEYSHEGTTICQNKTKLFEAVNSPHKYLFLCISVNDHLQKNSPAIFEIYLRALLNKSVETGKIVFLHTYMKYPASAMAQKTFTVDMYDDVLRKMAEDYNNVYYIDLSDINVPESFLEDGVHCNSSFNNELYRRLISNIKMIGK